MLFKHFLKPVVFFFLAISSLFSFEKPWGKDSSLCYPPPKKPQEKKTSILTKLAHQIILFRQKVLSPIDGPRSHFRPSSSQYMKLAMQRYGFFKGYIMGCDRLLRENNEPWVYRTISLNGACYKYDPASTNKHY